MGFAEEFEKNKRTVVIVAVLVVVALIVVVMTMSGPSRPSLPSGKAKVFYTSDDGKTWFADDAEQLPGFDHGGKPAYKAQVYQCGDGGKPFVGYLVRVEDGARKAAEAARAQGRGPKEIAELWRDKIEVKKPGEGKWVTTGPRSPGEKIMQVTCPDAKLTPTIVLPPAE